jgi:hypothetical protein
MVASLTSEPHYCHDLIVTIPLSSQSPYFLIKEVTGNKLGWTRTYTRSRKLAILPGYTARVPETIKLATQGTLTGFPRFQVTAEDSLALSASYQKSHCCQDSNGRDGEVSWIGLDPMHAFKYLDPLRAGPPSSCRIWSKQVERGGNIQRKNEQTN